MYLMLLFVIIIFISIITNKKIFVFSVIVLIFAIFNDKSKINLLNLLSEINLTDSELNYTDRNALFAIRNLNATRLDTVWTNLDRIDILKTDNEKIYIYFSNQLWSTVTVSKEINNISSKYASKKALVVGVGGGVEIAQLEDIGFRNITGLELSAELISLVDRNYDSQIFKRNKIIVRDARYFFKTTKEKFDLILHYFPSTQTKFDNKGWPFINPIYSPNTILEEYELLNQNGLLILKQHSKNSSIFQILNKLKYGAIGYEV
jgi:hypothetical protein